VKYYSQATQKLFLMKHRNNFHRGESGTVCFAIILLGATTKDNLPMPSPTDPVPFQILHRHVVSAGSTELILSSQL